jgi:hypothetical protein
MRSNEHRNGRAFPAESQEGRAPDKRRHDVVRTMAVGRSAPESPMMPPDQEIAFLLDLCGRIVFTHALDPDFACRAIGITIAMPDP